MDKNSGNYKNMSWVGSQMKKNGRNNNMQRPTPYQQPMQQLPRQMQTQQHKRQMQQPPPPMQAHPKVHLSHEQLAFEVEFTKWEKSFSDWQKAYVNHPDRVAYKQYEQKFLEVRDKLFVKRTQIYSKTSTERKLANELGAAAAMAESILNQFGESSASSFSGNSNRYSNPPPMININPHDRNMMRGQQDYSSPPYFDREPPGRGRDQNMGSRHDRGQNMGSRQDQGRSNDRNQQNRGLSNDRNQQNRGRSDDRNNRGGNQQWGGMNHQQRSGRSGERQCGFDRRQMDRPLKKPTAAQLIKEMERKNTYPNVPWIKIWIEEKPTPVGKRKKKKNAKIVKVMEELSPEGVSEAFEKAKNSDCPRRLSGAARRKLANLQKKNVAELTENEKKFQEFAEYCKNARDDFFRGRKGTQRNSMNKTQDEPKNHQEKPKAEVQEKPNIEVQGNSNIEVQDEPKSDVNSEEISESEAKIPRDTSEVVSSN